MPASPLVAVAAEVVKDDDGNVNTKPGWDTLSDWLVTSQKQQKNYKDLTNTITMVMEPPTPPVAWIWWIHAAGGAGGLLHDFSDAAIKAI